MMARMGAWKFLALLAGGVLILPSILYGAERPPTGRAVLSLNPASGSFLVGSTFDLSIILDTKGAAVNTAEVELDFPADKIQLANPSVGSSIIQLWPAPPVFSNREGRIYFLGGIPSPGIVTSQGVVLTLTFRVVAPGDSRMTFGEKTSLLANDGRGTNILGQKLPAFFKFLVPPPQGPAVSSPTHPDQERWYRDTNPVLVWPRGRFSDGYSYALDRDPSGFPDTVSEGEASTASFSDVGNGIWYFHVRELAGGAWGGVSHFVVKIDSQPPASFKLNVSPAKRTRNKNPIFRFFTTDGLSGLDHYAMKVVALKSGELSEGLFFEITSPYQAPTFRNGRYQVIVRAVDQAGNSRDETLTLEIVGVASRFADPEGLNLGFAFIRWSELIVAAGGLLLFFLGAFALLWGRHKHHMAEIFREDLKRVFRRREKTAKGFSAVFLLVLVGAFGAAAVFAFPQVFLIPALGAGPVPREPPAPYISVAPSVYYPLDEVLYLEGRALPKGKVELLFEKGGTPAARVAVEANANGEWFFSDRLELSSGEWMVRARLAGEAPSDWSNPRIVRSQMTGFFIGSVKIRYLPVLSLLVLAVAASAGLLYYSAKRALAIRRKEFEETALAKAAALEQALKTKERESASELIEKNFAELRRNILGELDHLEARALAAGGLSREETDHRQNLLAELRRVEEAIERKIKDIS